MKKIFLTCSFITLSLYISAQIFVQYDISPTIGTITSAHIEAWKDIKYVDGYRIQLYSSSGTNAKKNAQQIYDQFLELFPDDNVYLSYSEPYFRVRVGNYRNRFEANAALTLIKNQFTGAFITSDKIYFRIL